MITYYQRNKEQAKQYYENTKKAQEQPRNKYRKL